MSKLLRVKLTSKLLEILLNSWARECCQRCQRIFQMIVMKFAGKEKRAKEYYFCKEIEIVIFF